MQPHRFQVSESMLHDLARLHTLNITGMMVDANFIPKMIMVSKGFLASAIQMKINFAVTTVCRSFELGLMSTS